LILLVSRLVNVEVKGVDLDDFILKITANIRRIVTPHPELRGRNINHFLQVGSLVVIVVIVIIVIVVIVTGASQPQWKRQKAQGDEKKQKNLDIAGPQTKPGLIPKRHELKMNVRIFRESKMPTDAGPRSGFSVPVGGRPCISAAVVEATVEQGRHQAAAFSTPSTGLPVSARVCAPEHIFQSGAIAHSTALDHDSRATAGAHRAARPVDGHPIDQALPARAVKQAER
jgi:hypothetical protein